MDHSTIKGSWQNFTVIHYGPYFAVLCMQPMLENSLILSFNMIVKHFQIPMLLMLETFKSPRNHNKKSPNLCKDCSHDPIFAGFA